jgi:Allene oxide cyclase barrel like domain
MTTLGPDRTEQHAGPPKGEGVSFGPFTEVLTWQEVFQPMNRETPALGDGARWHIDLYDFDQGEDIIGTIDGWAVGVHVRPSDGHVIGWERATAKLLDTTFEILGPVDLTLGFHGQFRLTVRAIEGRYEGWMADWRYRVVKADRPPYWWQAELEGDILRMTDEPA